jgi:7-cyano-7-deazaguanine reductase
MARKPKTPDLKLLGRKTPLPASPDEAVLEKVDNANRGTPFMVRFTCPEFTALCPITGQPDFAHFVLDYLPDRWILESKSLKLYLASFRDIGVFHEDCTVGIARRVIAEIEPEWLRLAGYWYPRGGIPIDVFYQTGAPPDGLWVPDPGMPAYRGRG